MGRFALQIRYEACYVHIMQVLKFLISPGTSDGGAAALEREARMSIADRSSAKKILLQVRPSYIESLKLSCCAHHILIGHHQTLWRYLLRSIGHLAFSSLAIK